MKNQTISLNAPAVNIQLLPNDNSYIVRGTGPEGYINRSILKDDPECEQKLRNLLSSMHEFQQAQLQDFIAQSPGQLDQQYSNLTSELDIEFQPETKQS